VETSPRLGETSAFADLALEVLASHGWRPSLSGRPQGGVIVRLHRSGHDPIVVEGDTLADVVPELLRQAGDHVRRRRSAA
jgi:hypothetical protein